jgi:arabinogalactan oligomer/maltooligosaccharide transport system permease protein
MDRRSFVVAMACAVVLLLAGDASAAEAITLWHAYRGDEERALAQLVARYEREHPDVTIETLAIPFDAYSSKLAAAVPHAHGPDVYIEAHERLGAYLRDGLVAPIAAAFPDAEVGDYDPVAVSAITLAGVRYGAPLSSKCLALFVNEDLVPKTPATIEEIAALQGALPPGAYAIAYDTTDAFFHAAFLQGFGGAYVDEGGRFAFVGGAAERSLDLVRGLVQRGDVPQEPTYALITQLFATGRAATAIGGPWMVGDLRSAARWHVEPLPRIAAANGAPMRPFLTVEAVMTTPQGAARPAARPPAAWS